MQQQLVRRLSGRTWSSSTSTRFWVYCGIGAGVALALGLKYHADSSTTNVSCDADAVTTSRDEERYLAAIAVSRDLLRRLKVGYVKDSQTF